MQEIEYMKTTDDMVMQLADVRKMELLSITNEYSTNTNIASGFMTFGHNAKKNFFSAFKSKSIDDDNQLITDDVFKKQRKLLVLKHFKALVDTLNIYKFEDENVDTGFSITTTTGKYRCKLQIYRKFIFNFERLNNLLENAELTAEERDNTDILAFLNSNKSETEIADSIPKLLNAALPKEVDEIVFNHDENNKKGSGLKKIIAKMYAYISFCFEELDFITGKTEIPDQLDYINQILDEYITTSQKKKSHSITGRKKLVIAELAQTLIYQEITTQTQFTSDNINDEENLRTIRSNLDKVDLDYVTHMIRKLEFLNILLQYEEDYSEKIKDMEQYYTLLKGATLLNAKHKPFDREYVDSLYEKNCALREFFLKDEKVPNLTSQARKLKTTASRLAIAVDICNLVIIKPGKTRYNDDKGEVETLIIRQRPKN